MNFIAGEWRLGPDRSGYGDSTKFALYRVNEDKTRDVVTFHGEEARITRVALGDRIPAPSFFLDHDQQQAVMNTLWELGIRPNYRRYDEEIKLKDEHIGFLQRILDKLLGDKGMPA